MQRDAKPRYDPSEHAKKQQAAKERAKELRDARQRGVVNDACTFTPKVNPPRKTEDNNESHQPPSTAPPGSPPIRSKFHATQPPPSPPIRSKFQNQATADMPPPRGMSPPPSPVKRRPSNLKKPSTTTQQQPKIQANDSSDSLDRLSGTYASRSKSKEPAYEPYEAEEPEHDSLSTELKTRTGKSITREAKPKFAPPSGGECLRNSTCRCAQCDPSGAAPPLARQRQMKPAPSLPPPDSTAVDHSSLSLLKSKMSRRKSRSAPTKPASMFVDDDKPRQLVHSAREPPPRQENPMAAAAPAARRRQAPRPTAFEPPPPANVFDGVPDGVRPFLPLSPSFIDDDARRAKYKTTVLIMNVQTAIASLTRPPSSSIK
ncbi:unnamed protein product [Aphanomyces euteiches]